MTWTHDAWRDVNFLKDLSATSRPITPDPGGPPPTPRQRLLCGDGDAGGIFRHQQKRVWSEILGKGWVSRDYYFLLEKGCIHGTFMVKTMISGLSWIILKCQWSVQNGAELIKMNSGNFFFGMVHITKKVPKSWNGHRYGRWSAPQAEINWISISRCPWENRKLPCVILCELPVMFHGKSLISPPNLARS